MKTIKNVTIIDAGIIVGGALACAINPIAGISIIGAGIALTMIENEPREMDAEDSDEK